MADPLTLLLVKVAALTAAGSVAALWPLLGQAANSSSNWLVAGSGVGAIVVLIWKLVSDHTTVMRERAASDRHQQSLRADLAEARALTARAVAEARTFEAVAYEIWTEARLAGVDMAPVVSFVDRRQSRAQEHFGE